MTPLELSEMEALCFPNARVTWSEADYAAHLKSETGLTVSTDTGFVVGQIAADQAEIITLGVLPDYRKQGHGTDLLTSFEHAAQKRGATEIFLEVSAENTAAIALYRANKFESVGRRRKYYKNAQGMAVDAFILKKEI